MKVSVSLKQVFRRIEAYTGLADPRLKNLPFTGSPIPVLTVVTFYLLFVLGRGQKWMENRKPFELNKIMSFYNIFQVLANACVFLMV